MFLIWSDIYLMGSLINQIKDNLKNLSYENRAFGTISFILSLFDVLLYIIVKLNLSYVIYKDSFDIDSSLRYILSSLKINLFLVFFLSFTIRFFITSKLLSTICKKDLFLSFCFSLFFVTANSYEQLDNSSLFLSSEIQVLLALFVFCLLFSFCLNIIIIVKKILPLLNSWNPKLPVIFVKHIFLFSNLFIFIAWFPFIIFRYPAGVEWDGYHQLMMFQGDMQISQHWPIVSTYFFGILFSVGKFIFQSNDNGIFFTVVVQSIICSSCFSYSILVQKRISISNGVILFCLFSYAFLTIYPRYLTSIVKDALFSSIVLLFISFLIYIIHCEYHKLKKSRFYYLEFIVVIFLVCSLRHTGMYIILFCMLLSGIWFYHSRKRFCLTLFILFLSSLSIFISFSSVVSSYIGKNPLYPRMMYCIPFQQTARYISQNKKLITNEQQEIINNIIDYDIAIKKYNPKLCDPVVNLYHASDIRNQLDYIKKIWLPFFFQSPVTYFAATYNQNEGFFYPFANQVEKNANYYFGSNWNSPEEPAYFSSTPSLFEPFKNLLLRYSNYFESFFIFFFFCNCGLNCWAVISCIFYSKKTLCNFMLLAPSLVIILTLIAGPTFYWNGERYALPIFCCNLFLISILSKHFDFD